MRRLFRKLRAKMKEAAYLEAARRDDVAGVKKHMVELEKHKSFFEKLSHADPEVRLSGHETLYKRYSDPHMLAQPFFDPVLACIHAAFADLAVPIVIKSLSDVDVRVRAKARLTLGLIIQASTKMVHANVGHVEVWRSVRNKASQAVEQVGDAQRVGKYVDFEEGMRHPEPGRRLEALEVEYDGLKDAVALAPAFSSGIASEASKRIKTLLISHLPLLVTSLSDPDARVRNLGCLTVGLCVDGRR
jgi:hypothetical protein